VPLPDLLALALVATLGAAAQTATGFGVALPIAPVAFALLSPADAVIVIAGAGLLHNVLVVATRHRRLQVRTGDGALLLAAALPGLLLGALIVSRISKAPMQLAAGVTILAAVLLRVHEPGRVRALAHRIAGVPIGLLSGILATTVGITGPPLVIWLRARQTPLAAMRDTLAIIFLVLNLIAIPSVAAHGASVPAVLVPAIAAAIVLGHAIGLQAHRRLEAATLDRLLVVILTAAALASIAGAVSAWW
jgi:uncharacterized membrane protein YfcA